MTSAVPKELLEALKSIRESFLDDLVKHINDMENLCQHLDDPQNALAAIAGLQSIVHKISGIAGSVGFAEMGDEAGRLDMAFGEVLKGPYDPAAVDTVRDPLEAFLDHLKNAFDEKLVVSDLDPLMS